MAPDLLLAALSSSRSRRPRRAEARTGPCLPGRDGPRCTLWTAKVIHVHDGDTIEARSSGRMQLVRVTGIHAMEKRVYSSIPGPPAR